MGFKSFPDKTVLHFQEGITGVVGPNGCGKSNIVDAIRWVMGEMSAKHLRGKSMEDVIFSGTTQRNPMGMASVTMVFSTEDGRVPSAYAHFSEVAINRRLYRSGESEYYINQTQCRLRDIHDLFLGTGVGVRAYSIIEQGRIGQVISAKPEERRLILEEAAGISKFKNRKEAALRKIEATRANLLRLSDIISELKRQINSLDRQARKAERYQILYKELKEIELHLNSLDYLLHRRNDENLSQEVSHLQDQETQISVQVESSENKLAEIRLALQEKEAEYMTRQEQLYEKNNSIQLHQTRIDYKTREIQTLGEQKQVAGQEIEMGQSRLNTLEDEIAQLHQSREQAELQLKSDLESYRNLQAKLEESSQEEYKISEAIEQKNEQVYAVMKSLSEKNNQVQNSENRQLELSKRLSKSTEEIESIEGQLKEQQKKEKRLQSELSEMQQSKLDLEVQKNSLQETLTKQTQALEQLSENFEALKDELGLKSSRLNSLEELEKSYEGYEEGVKSVLSQRAERFNQEEILGTLADFVETESQYELALSAALGEKLQYVLVKDRGAAVQAFDYLKTEAKGRLACLPLEFRQAPSPSSFQGFNSTIKDKILGPIRNYIKVKPGYEKLADLLLDQVFLVKNLSDAIEVWETQADCPLIVSLEGEVINPEGMMRGGSQKSNPGQALLEKKREIKSLKVEVADLEKKREEYSEELETYRRRIGVMEKALEDLQKDTHSEELKSVQHQQGLEHLQNENKRLSHRQAQLSQEIAEIRKEESELKTKMIELRQLIADFESQRDAQQLSLRNLKEELTSAKESLEKLRSDLLEGKSQLSSSEGQQQSIAKDAQRLLSEKEQILQRIQDKQSNIQQSEEKIAILQQEVSESRNLLAQWVNEVQGEEEIVRNLKEGLQTFQTEIQNSELSLRKSRNDLQEIRQSLQNKLQLLNEARTRMQILTEQMFERYQIHVAEIAPQYQDQAIDRETQAPYAKELREKLEKMGHVNLGAIEEYDELKTRYEFLQQQYDDLETSLDKLLKALQKVNRTTKKHFQESFEKINELFRQVFPQLFKGGSAELRLTDPENILESGVDIVAQPPGKRLQNVNLLSGGEKALTAISLVFAIFLLKPSPFCLLDEVDAPLDDANIDRFNEMVQSMTDRSQFILITHNKRTMEMADVLYGVTMEQAGVSKMVSVELKAAS